MMVKKVGAKKRRVSKKAPMIPRPIASKEHVFTRLASSNYGTGNPLPLSVVLESVTGRPTFTTGVNSGQSLALQFRLDQVDVYLNGAFSSSFSVPNYAEFTNLFDEYCIKRVDVGILPSYITGGFGSSSVQNYVPMVIHATDYDDVASSSAAVLMQFQDAKFTQLLGSMGRVNAPYIRSIVPRAKFEVLTATAGNGVFHPKSPQWIISGNPNVPHLGFKMSLDDSYNGGTPGTFCYAFNIVVRYTIGCRDVV